MDPSEAGLCGRCRHCRMVEGHRSRFVLCRRHEDAPEDFPRYPRLPVTACPGFEPGPAGPEGPRGGQRSGGP